MTKQHELLQSIIEHRANIQKKDEQKHYKSLQKTYDGQKTLMLGSLASFFDKNSVKDKLHKSKINKNSLNKLEKEFSEHLNGTYREEKKLARKGIKSGIKDEYLYTLFMLNGLRETKNEEITTEDINEMFEDDWSGETYDKTLKRRKKETTGKLKRDVLRLAAGGVGIRELNKQVKKRMDSDMKHSLMVYQNEQTRKRDQSKSLAFKKEGIKAKKFMWVATLDDKTCEHCSPLDSLIFKEEEIPQIPLHSRCRCRVVEIIDDWEQTTRRARDMKSYKSYVTNSKNYDDWRREQGL